MKPLFDIERLNLTNAQARDFNMILPFMETGEWVTSISLARRMYENGNYWRKEIAKISTKLSRLFHFTNLLVRMEKRRIYFHNIHKRHTSFFAYKINPNLLKLHEYEHIQASSSEDLD